MDSKKSDYAVCDFHHMRTLNSIGYKVGIPDMVYMDQVSNLQKDSSRGFWCTMSNEDMCFKMGFSDSGLRTMKRRLKAMGLIESQGKGRTGVRVTPRYLNCIPSSESDDVTKDTTSSESDEQGRQKVTTTSSESDDKRKESKEKVNKEKDKKEKEKILSNEISKLIGVKIYSKDKKKITSDFFNMTLEEQAIALSNIDDYLGQYHRKSFVFFEKYNRIVGMSDYRKTGKQKDKILNLFDSLSNQKQTLAIDKIENYYKAFKEKQKKSPDLKPLTPNNYLEGERWNDKVAAAEKPKSTGAIRKFDPSMFKRPESEK